MQEKATRRFLKIISRNIVTISDTLKSLKTLKESNPKKDQFFILAIVHIEDL